MYVIRCDLKKENSDYEIINYPKEKDFEYFKYYMACLNNRIKPIYKEMAIKLGAKEVLLDAHTFEYQFEKKECAERMLEFINSIVIMKKLRRKI